MATWAGWQRQFLNRANILLTPPTLRFLTSWADHAATNCGNNPNDLSHKLTGSTNCAQLHGIFPQAQHYTTHAQAASAFRAEVHLPFAEALLHALQAGNPYQVHDPSPVASVLVSWGSDEFANVYLAAAQGASGGGGGSGAEAQLLAGWHSLRRSTNTNWRKSLNRSERSLHAALRSLSHSRKVRL